MLTHGARWDEVQAGELGKKKARKTGLGVVDDLDFICWPE